MTAEDNKPESVLEEAVNWLLRLNTKEHDPALVRDFEAWLSQSDDHGKAWEQARKSWQLMGEVAPAYEHLWRDSKPAGADRPATAPVRMRGRSGWWGRGFAIAAAAALCLVMVLSYPSLLLRIQADYMTGTAESRTIKLADSTWIELAADSAIKVDFTGERRHVILLAGEAFFDVTHDAVHPFVVDAGGAAVSDLGTAFNVQLSSTQTSIELAQGAVGVSFTSRPRGEVQLAPGEMAVVDRQTGEISTGNIAQEDIAAWREGRLFVNDVTIRSVVEQLQRYSSAWISMPDGTLATQKVTGLYDLRDADRALRALVEPYGGKVREISPLLRLVTRF